MANTYTQIYLHVVFAVEGRRGMRPALYFHIRRRMLFIFSAGSLIYITRSTNDLAFQASVDIEGLKQIQNPTPVDTVKKQFLEKRLEVALADRKFFTYGIGVVAAISLILMWYGFHRWHKVIQPVQDKIAHLQLEKLKIEVQKLKSEQEMEKSKAS